MIHIYSPNSGSVNSQKKYCSYKVEEAKKIVEDFLNDKDNPRIIINILTSKRIVSRDELRENDVIKILPIVGGG